MNFSNVSIIGNELGVVLSNGQEMYFPLPMLRRSCPCALCQGEPDALGRVLRPRVEYVEASFVLKKFELVGGYGIQLYWSDLHSSGIYSLDYLKKLDGIV